MIKIIIPIIILFISFNLLSQEDYVKLDRAKTQKPTYIFNKNIIGNEYILKSLGSSEEEVKKQVEEISILKDKQNREGNDYYNLTEYGLLFVDLKDNLPSKTQAELNHFFGLDKQSEIYIDGYLLESKSYRIAIAHSFGIEIIEPNNENKLKSKVLNIWTLPKNERYRDMLTE